MLRRVSNSACKGGQNSRVTLEKVTSPFYLRIFKCFLHLAFFGSRYWLYGEKVSRNDQGGGDAEEMKGWFPRRCIAIQRKHRHTCKNFEGHREGHEHDGHSANDSESSNSHSNENGRERDANETSPSTENKKQK